MSLEIFVSDTYELLEKLLAKHVKESFQKPGMGVLQPVPIIIPTLGVGRRVRMTLADEFQVDGNLEFSYLAQWMWQEIHRFVPSFGLVKDMKGYALAWRIYGYLHDETFLQSQPRLSAFVQSANSKRCWQLAQHLSKVFTAYNAYRLDWVQAWIQGGDPKALFPEEEALTEHPDYAWQKAFWQQLGRDFAFETVHPSEMLKERLQSCDQELGDVHVFMPQNVPPLYLQLLVHLASRRKIYLYLKNPCSVYWLDIQSRRRLRAADVDEQVQRHWAQAEGHPLLAGWAGQTKAMLQLLQQFIDDGVTESVENNQYEAFLHETFEPSNNLQHLQHSIGKMDLTYLEAMEPNPEDRSLEFHSAYSLKREVEVLKDYLLARFADDESLKSSDVLVVTPDIDKLAPIVESVFANDSSTARIAYRIQGRSGLNENACAELLSAWMKLLLGGVKAQDVFDLLSRDVLAKHFNLNGDDLQVFARWFDESGFRNGLNEQSLEDEGLGAISAHSFETALDRLFLAYAKPEAFDGVFNDLVVTGQTPERDRLEVLARFYDAVKRFAREAQAASSIESWHLWLVSILEEFCTDSIFDEDRVRCMTAIDELVDECQKGMRGHDPFVITLDLLSEVYESKFNDWSAGATPTPAVTFTNMSGLQGLSYKLICVVGLNDGVFPSTNRPDDFDLMGHFARKGDRQRIKDDRNTFFDLLMNATEGFYVSFTGRNNKDASVENPSILVDELLDTLCNHQPELLDASARMAWRSRWVIEHPMYRYSIANFTATDPRLIHHDAGLMQKVQDYVDNQVEQVGAFWKDSMAGSAESIRALELKDLQSFWKHPLRWFWKRRLRLLEPEEIETLENEETYQLDALATWKLKTLFLEHIDDPKGFEKVSNFVAHDPRLQVAPLNESSIAQAQATYQKNREKIVTLVQDTTAQTHTFEVEFELDGQKRTLYGNTSSLYGDRLIRVSASKMQAARIVESLIEWAAVCASGKSVSLTLICQKKADDLKGLRTEASGLCLFEQAALSEQEAKAQLGVWWKYFEIGQRQPLWALGSGLLAHCLKVDTEQASQTVYDKLSPYLLRLAAEPSTKREEMILEYIRRDSLAVSQALQALEVANEEI